jgi:serine/threonine protein kinase
MAAELHGRRIGGWIVGSYLGNGFSAVVLAAEKDGMTGAVKIIDPEMVERAGKDSQLRRVMREQELSGHGHPNLVNILDGGQCGETGYLYVVMELLEPRTLGKALKRIPRTQIGPLIGQLARAARYLEERGIAHRDIKPDNTVVSPDFLTVKLLDLGVIHPPADPNDPSAGTGDRFVGTARYSPPEFLYREEEDTTECWRAITLYQLGATLHDLLMRRQIFSEFRDPPARLYQAVKDQVPLIDAADCEPWLVELARRCLHKDWRVRKEIVSWQDFDGPRSPPASAQEIRERLKRRGAPATAAPVLVNSGTNTQPTRRTLIQLSGAVATITRELCQQGGVFPPTEVSDSVDGHTSIITLRTGPSQAHNLDAALEIRLACNPLDTEAQHVKVTVCARLGGPTTESTCGGYQLFVGAPSAEEFKEALDIYLHLALEASLGTGTPPSEGLAIQPYAMGS